MTRFFWLRDSKQKLFNVYSFLFVMNKNLRNGFLGLSALVLAGCGSSGPNKAILTINSEPPGARVYGDGQYMGTTPISPYWDIKDEHYDRGFIQTPKFTLGKEGYLPKESSFRLSVNSSWRRQVSKKI